MKTKGFPAHGLRAHDTAPLLKLDFNSAWTGGSFGLPCVPTFLCRTEKNKYIKCQATIYAQVEQAAGDLVSIEFCGLSQPFSSQLQQPC